MALQEKIAKNQTFTSTLNCQRCTNALKLNFSLKEIDDEVFDDLSHSKYLNADEDDRNVQLQIYHKKLESSAMRKVMIPANICDIASDFMVVGELASLPLDSTQSFKITDTLLSLTSDQSAIDHPLCEACTDSILDQMDSQLKMAENESELYQQVLQSLKKKENNEDLEELQAELKELKKEEAVLEAQLKEFEAIQRSKKEILESYVEEATTLENEERKHWNEYCQIKHNILSAEDTERSVNNQLIYAQAQLNKLTNTNVFSTTFHIWHSGHFGTINNFRLGRLPKEPVEWLEINAAWGQTVLLLHSLAQKINLTFVRYRLVPYGNHSYIVPLDNKTKYLPLYCLGGIKYVLDNRFDDAMVAFLDCLQQFKEEVENGDGSFHLPYKMDKGKIEDKSAGKSYSIKIYLNSQEQWTKALKFMLTNLKWALAWVSTQFQDN